MAVDKDEKVCQLEWMDTFCAIWSRLTESSVWDEADHVRLVWISMLAKQDRDHVVRATAYNIGRWARKSEAEALDALRILSSPDTKRIEPQPHEGRRIAKVEGGWLILNGQEYEDKLRLVFQRARQARWQAGYREGKRGFTGGAGPLEARVGSPGGVGGGGPPMVPVEEAVVVGVKE